MDSENSFFLGILQLGNYWNKANAMKENLLGSFLWMLINEAKVDLAKLNIALFNLTIGWIQFLVASFPILDR